MGKKDQVLRLAGCDASGARSSSWRFWASGSECYASANGVGNSYKASFHNSGACQIELTSELIKDEGSESCWRGEGRFWDRWTVENDPKPGEVVLLLNIIVPHRHLERFTPPEKNKPEFLICQADTSLCISLYKENPSSQALETNFDQIFRIQMENGYNFLIMAGLSKWTKEDLNPVEQALRENLKYKEGQRRYVNKTVEGLQTDSRAILGWRQDLNRFWFDLSVKKCFEE